MQCIVTTLLVLLNILAARPQFPPTNNVADYLKDAAQLWIKFKLDHSKQFSPQEDLFRFNVFKENLRRLDDLRKRFEKGDIHFRVSINHFADLSKDEFVSKYLQLKAPQARFGRDASNRTKRQTVPSVDWRNRGAVTPAKNQGLCASCWAFSAAGALESHYYLKTGSLVSLSEQNLLDCSSDQTNNGCAGGWMANAFQYVTSSPITSENEYPYVGSKQNCDYNPKNFRISIQGFQTISPGESSLEQAVASVGPISVAMDATNLQFYAGGVYRDDECTNRVNHGVVVVGYGSEGGRDYWLVKNSWGSNWGESGYFKMIRNRGNQCGIASYGMYPIM